ncbi:hypothetical protein [Martelella soudanensis]|uniref:hypothetical protein n=1 Tax=unclassified Martelella TaxID=2629616 RepID=UPI0015DFD759|nr:MULTISPECIES: hypothetical protein [unclassified Martelella]
MKFGRMILSVTLVAAAALVAACSTTCGKPDVCDTGTAAYAQFTDEDVATMTTKLDGLAGLPAAQ